MVTLIITLAGAFVLAGGALLARSIARRRRGASDRRRLSSLGSVDAHRERYR